MNRQLFNGTVSASFQSNQIKGSIHYPDIDNMPMLKKAFDPTSIRQYFVEFLGTLFFVFMATGAVVSTEYVGPLNSGAIVAIGLGFGFSLAAVIFATANYSGGHINPAVTVGFMVTNNIHFIKGIFYILSQLAGAMVGSALLRATTPERGWRAANLGATKIAEDLSLASAFFFELIITFILVFTIFATVDVPKKADSGVGKLSAMAVGLALLACHLVGAPFTGPSMNPARSFGPAVVSGYWDNHWVYWVGPLAGGILAGLIFKFVLLNKMPWQQADSETQSTQPDKANENKKGDEQA